MRKAKNAPPIRESLAYAAGLFEGEGSINVYTTKYRGKTPKDYLGVRIGLTTTDKDVA